MNYEVRITWDSLGGIYVARVPELPGCSSHGKTREEAARNVEEAIELHVESLRELGEPVPAPWRVERVESKFKYAIQITWSETDAAYVARVPDLPGCSTHGKTLEEVARNVEEAIEVHLEGLAAIE